METTSPPSSPPAPAVAAATAAATPAVSAHAQVHAHAHMDTRDARLLAMANSLLARTGVPGAAPLVKIQQLQASASSLFIAVFERLFGVVLQTVTRQPTSREEYTRNAQELLDALRRFLPLVELPMDVTGQAISAGDKQSIERVLVILCELNRILPRPLTDMVARGEVASAPAATAVPPPVNVGARAPPPPPQARTAVPPPRLPSKAAAGAAAKKPAPKRTVKKAVPAKRKPTTLPPTDAVPPSPSTVDEEPSVILPGGSTSDSLTDSLDVDIEVKADEIVEPALLNTAHAEAVRRKYQMANRARQQRSLKAAETRQQLRQEHELKALSALRKRTAQMRLAGLRQRERMMRAMATRRSKLSAHSQQSAMLRIANAADAMKRETEAMRMRRSSLQSALCNKIINDCLKQERQAVLEERNFANAEAHARLQQVLQKAEAQRRHAATVAQVQKEQAAIRRNEHRMATKAQAIALEKAARSVADIQIEAFEDLRNAARQEEQRFLAHVTDPLDLAALRGALPSDPLDLLLENAETAKKYKPKSVKPRSRVTFAQSAKGRLQVTARAYNL